MFACTTTVEASVETGPSFHANTTNTKHTATAMISSSYTGHDKPYLCRSSGADDTKDEYY